GYRPRLRPGEYDLCFPLDVLGTVMYVPMPGDPLRDCFERDGGRKKPHSTLVGDFAGREKCAEVLPGLGWPDVHLPVRGEDERSHLSSSAATPGNSFPSRNSSDAPPPVETCVSLSSIPATAATESPPPTTVTAPFFPAAARAFAIAREPASNGGRWNAPLGPFHKT